MVQQRLGEPLALVSGVRTGDGELGHQLDEGLEFLGREVGLERKAQQGPPIEKLGEFRREQLRHPFHHHLVQRERSRLVAIDEDGATALSACKQAGQLRPVADHLPEFPVEAGEGLLRLRVVRCVVSGLDHGLDQAEHELGEGAVFRTGRHGGCRGSRRRASGRVHDGTLLGGDRARPHGQAGWGHSLASYYSACIVPNEPSVGSRSMEPHPVGFDCFAVGRTGPGRARGSGERVGGTKCHWREARSLAPLRRPLSGANVIAFDGRFSGAMESAARHARHDAARLEAPQEASSAERAGRDSARARDRRTRQQRSRAPRRYGMIVRSRAAMISASSHQRLKIPSGFPM